jgi:hypothetical protein
MAEKLGGDRLVVLQVWLPISHPSGYEILIYLQGLEEDVWSPLVPNLGL